MQLLSENLVENQSLQPSKQQSEKTDALEEGRRKNRERLLKWKRLNPEKSKQHSLNWYYRNRSAVLEKRNHPDQKEKIRAAAKKYGQDPKRKARRRELYALSPEKWREKTRARNATPEGRAYASAYQRKRRKENFDVHFMNWIRGSVNRCLRNQGQSKIARTREYLGCTPLELVAHLQAQFEPGMDWTIPRSWDVDHIIPSSVFDLSDREEAMWMFNYRNLRPMDRMQNKYKSNKLPAVMPSWLPPHIAERILIRSNL